MIGLAVVFLISWLILCRVKGESILVLGLTPNKQRGKEFLIGFVYMATIAVINFLWQADFKQISYELNPSYSLSDFFHGSFWIFRAVLFEELVFRGVLLYLLINYIGLVKACLVSSIIFGVYHWFSYEVFGARFILMAYVFLVTGAGGWLFAFAYAKTKSLYAPLGLHLGWNIVTAVVFSSGPLGNQLLLQHGEAIQTSDWPTLIFFILQAVVAPGIASWFLIRRYKHTTSNEQLA